MNPASDEVQQERRNELRDIFIKEKTCTTRDDWNEELCIECEYNKICPRITKNVIEWMKLN